MEEKTIRAVELVRRIRDAYARDVVGKSGSELIEFYRSRGEELRREIEAERERRRPAERR